MPKKTKCGSATAKVVCLGTNESNTARLMYRHVYSNQPGAISSSSCHRHSWHPRPWTNMGFFLFLATRPTTHWTISRRRLATVAEHLRKVPQTAIEKIVQKYAIGLPDGKLVKAGDYVMIRPEHVMTHDNTGPVISKFVGLLFGPIPKPLHPNPPPFYTQPTVVVCLMGGLLEGLMMAGF